MVCNGDNDAVINSIFDGLFERNQELYVEDEFDADGMLVYKPPPLHEVWLDEAGHCQGKEDLLRQRHQNEELMRAQRKETQERMGPIPLLPTPAKDIVPKGAPVSDHDIVWFRLFTANIQNQRENLGMMTTTMVLFTLLIPLLIQISKNEGAEPNLIPEGDESIQAHEGAAVPPAPNIGRWTRNPTHQYPPAR